MRSANLQALVPWHPLLQLLVGMNRQGRFCEDVS